VKQGSWLLAFATVSAVVAYPVMAFFGVMFLMDGRIVTGIVLLACVVYGVPSFIQFRRRFASRNARPS